MRLGTHVTGGVLAYTVSATFFQLPWTATGVVVASAAAAAPDVDTLGSTVGRVFSPLARRIERRFDGWPPVLARITVRHHRYAVLA